MFSMDTLGKLYIFGHNGDMFHMNGAYVGIFQEPNQICFCSFLQSQNGTHLEAHIVFPYFKGYLAD